MTQKEIFKLRVLNQIVDGALSNKEAAQALGLSTRQVMRLKKGVQQQGPEHVIHKNRGRKPAHAVSEKSRTDVVKLKQQTPYDMANFTHFTELLAEYEDIHISRPVVHRILKAAGINSPKKHRRQKSHNRRKRAKHSGALIQIDASPFAWIVDNEPYALHGAIDDATNTVTGLFMAPAECLEGYFTVMHQMISHYGIPAQIYSDRHTIFFSPNKDKLTEDEQLQGKSVNLTQFGHALEELGIVMIPAKSAPAKGRIERLWETLQSRLPVEITLRNLSCVDAVNHYLTHEFLPRFNQQFTVKPECSELAFTPLDRSITLDYVLCRKYECKLDAAGAFSFQNQLYQVVMKHKPKVPPRAKITVLNSSKFGVRASYQGTVYSVAKVDKRSQPVKTLRLQPAGKVTTPPSDHPWKNVQHPQIYYDSSDREILEAIFTSQRAWW